MVMAVVIQVHTILAQNRLSLLREPGNRIALHLSNTDRVAGLQFSINAHGIAMGAYEGTERTASAALGIYQYLKDESTMNVVILAPVRSFLPAGEGAIGNVSFTVKTVTGDDTIQVSLSRVVICDVDAKALNVTSAPLSWQNHQVSDSQQKDFALEQNYPNPFNPSTTIAYRLDKPAHVRLAVYDMRGRQVRMLVDQYQPEGRYDVRWYANDGDGMMPASGTYFAQLRVGNQTAIKKMVYAK
jgi:hypothetical protein